MTAPTVAARWVRVGLADAITVELTGQLPIDILELVRQAEAQAYTRGRQDAWRHIAAEAGRPELGRDWRVQAAEDYAKRAEELRKKEESRAAEARTLRNLAAGRHPDWEYRGRLLGGSGTVCWETGYPIETVNAWLARPRPVLAPAVPPYRPAPRATVTALPERAAAVERRAA